MDGRANITQQRIISDVVRSRLITCCENHESNSGGTLKLSDFRCFPWPAFDIFQPPLKSLMLENNRKIFLKSPPSWRKVHSCDAMRPSCVRRAGNSYAVADCGSSVGCGSSIPSSTQGLPNSSGYSHFVRFMPVTFSSRFASLGDGELTPLLILNKVSACTLALSAISLMVSRFMAERYIRIKI